MNIQPPLGTDKSWEEVKSEKKEAGKKMKIGARVVSSNGIEGIFLAPCQGGILSRVFNLTTATEGDWVNSLFSEAQPEAEPMKPVYIVNRQVGTPLGRIVGGLLLANLISGVIGLIVLGLMGIIH